MTFIVRSTLAYDFEQILFCPQLEIRLLSTLCHDCVSIDRAVH